MWNGVRGVSGSSEGEWYEGFFLLLNLETMFTLFQDWGWGKGPSARVENIE